LKKQKILIGSINLIFLHGKLWIIPFWLMRWKLWGVLVWGQLWIPYSKINFEVVYLTQFSIFFEKNKNIGCRLFITTFQLLGLAIFDSITKFMTILNFESFSISFYLLSFSYMLYNSKWSEIFQAHRKLDLKNESKEALPIWTFFHANVTLWSAATWFLTQPKKAFLSIQTLISCNPHGRNFWNFFHIFSN